MHPVEEIYEIMHWNLYHWTKEYIEAKEKRLILNCGRKSGKTIAESVKAYLMLEDGTCPGIGFDGGILIVSKGERQAKEMLNTIKGLCVRIGGWQFTKERNNMNEETRTAFASVHEIQFPNKNRLLALPCGYNADSLRPYSFHSGFFDEADYHPEDVFISTRACFIVHGGQITLASTPQEGTKATKSYFYKCWHDPEFRRWEVPTRMCAHISKEELAREKRQMTKSQFEREYECKFTDAQEGLYPGGLIAACMKDTLNRNELFKNSIVYLGVDFARFGKDDNVIAACCWNGEKAYIFVETVRGRFRTTHITGRIRSLCTQYPAIRKVITDETGVGAGPTDSLVEALGHHKVLGVENHRRVDQGEGRPSRLQNQDLHTNLVRLMENGKIQYDDDISIVRSLRSMRYEYNSHGLLRIYGYDSHIAEAIVRSVFPLLLHRPQKLWIKFGN